MADGNDVATNTNDNYGNNIGLMNGGIVINNTTNTRLAIERPWLVPPQPLSPYFTGRRYILGRLKACLADHPDSAGFKCVSLHGPAGCGKTEAGLKYVLENRSRYWGVFWIDASTVESATDCFHLARTLLGQDQGSPVPFVRSYLASIGKPWLLVLDTAGDPDVRISSFIPPAAFGHVLITTRESDLHDVDVSTYLEMPMLSQEKSMELLQKRGRLSALKDPGILQTLGSLVREMDQDLLSLIWAADSIREGRQPQSVLDSYRDRLKARPSTAVVSKGTSNQHACSKASVSFEISLDELKTLSTEGSNSNYVSRSDARAALDILDQLTWLHRTGSPAVVLEASLRWKHKKDIVKLAREAVQLRRSLRLLEKLSLITLHSNGDTILSYQVQSSLRDWLRDGLSEAEAYKSWHRALDATVAAVRYYDSASSREKHWSEKIAPQIGAILQSRRRTIQDHSSLDQPNDIERYRDLTEAQLQTTGGAHLSVCTSLLNAELQRFLEKNEARMLSRGEATRVRDAYIKLFRAAEHQHDWQKCLAVAKDFRTVTNSIFSKSFLGHLWASFALAKAEYYLQRYAESIELLRAIAKDYDNKNIMWRQKTSNEGRVRVVTRIIILLADAYSGNGELVEARRILEALAEIFRKDKDKPHKMTLEVERALSGLYVLQKDYRRALNQLEQVYKIESHTFSPDHYEALRTCRRLGSLYRHTGQLKKSIKHLEHVVETLEKSAEKVPLLGVRLKEYLWALDLLETSYSEHKDMGKANATHAKVLSAADNMPESIQREWKILKWKSDEPEGRMLVSGLGDV